MTGMRAVRRRGMREVLSATVALVVAGVEFERELFE